ncbi:FAD-binding oxidoreductase [Paralcaligenes sp. KSB-10]|uniref:NAD(P)/FAD-dependent oxidoreductase n=1 Tax=Paralcaligenes sp. KSB-10 TaxID=2901142 RepID=UPI001E57DDA2|nr:FAD-binding oxidoreductase [Paralcaligenes sp. KSB-10]UHL64093.1 FAD-binding oxidoreductase [Paralcaligenes sp. KSB-10]
MLKQHYDYLIIGAGIAGASLAYRLAAQQASVLVIEQEKQAGYHSTGRSAAMFMESYGTPTIQALTRASRAFLESPPPNFCTHELIKDRGVLYIAHRGQETLLEETLKDLRACGASVKRVSSSHVLAKVPCVKAQDLIGAIEEPDAKDIDVDALHQGFLKGARQAGAEILLGTRVTAARRQGQAWNLSLAGHGDLTVSSVINTAGAWGDSVAALFGVQPVGLQPKRRSAFTFKANAYPDTEHWPAVVDIDNSFYFKPDAGQLLGSPANEDPVEPHDVVPEELDIAIGIDRIQSATTLEIRRPGHVWAGLRSFVPDGELVMGWDPEQAGFFWLVAQGGYGIQTCVAASLLASNLVLGQALDPSLAAERIRPEIMSPRRFRSAPVV